MCFQGYYVPSQGVFIAADPEASAYAQHPITNTKFTKTAELLTALSIECTSTQQAQGTRYMAANGTTQVGYLCSICSVTEWEKPKTLSSPERYYDDPMYYSRYMDTYMTADGFRYTAWEDMHWTPLYKHTVPKLDNSVQGLKQPGYWRYKQGAEWKKGKCLVEFQRICESQLSKALDLSSNSTETIVTDPDISYLPRVSYSNARVQATSRWSMDREKCINQVQRGCFNNGTCTAPDVCVCATGWTGYDCTIPICTQECAPNGICTLPNTCTCEIGWMGRDCAIPLCAQECLHVTCVAPRCL